MLKWFRTRMGDWALPPAAQDPAGLQRDQDFAPSEPGFWQTLLGRGSDGRLYEMSPSDRKRNTLGEETSSTRLTNFP